MRSGLRVAAVLLLFALCVVFAAAAAVSEDTAASWVLLAGACGWAVAGHTVYEGGRR